MAITQENFRAALSRFPSGVTVVTTKDGSGVPHGITVSAFCSVSLEPPMVLICIEKSTASHNAFSESEVFAVNILNETQSAISEQFAAPFFDKFESIDLEVGELGVPLIRDALVNLECRLRHSFGGGDHSIFVGEVESVRFGEHQPLLYFRGNYHGLDRK